MPAYLPPEQWERLIAVNLSGYANMARHTIAAMLCKAAAWL